MQLILLMKKIGGTTYNIRKNNQIKKYPRRNIPGLMKGLMKVFANGMVKLHQIEKGKGKDKGKRVEDKFQKIR